MVLFYALPAAILVCFSRMGFRLPWKSSAQGLNGIEKGPYGESETEENDFGSR